MHHFHIPSMACGGCLTAVMKAIQKLDPRAHTEGKLEDRTITVTSDEAEASLLSALENAGYSARVVSADR